MKHCFYDAEGNLIAKTLKQVQTEYEALPSEVKREREYRRAYRDGWIQAIDALHVLMFDRGMGRQEAYDRAWDWWAGELRRWQMENHGGRIKWPPLPQYKAIKLDADKAA